MASPSDPKTELVKTTPATTVVAEREPPPPSESLRKLLETVKSTSEALSWTQFDQFMDKVESGENKEPGDWTALRFVGLDSYTLLKKAVELFVTNQATEAVSGSGPADAEAALKKAHSNYMAALEKHVSDPYMNVILDRVGGPPAYVLWRKMARPLRLELIWSYWMEEGLLVQTMNAVTMRFQNRRVSVPGQPNVLQRLELEPLRPLASLLFGYVEAERDRLSVARRAYEYLHEYGLSLRGRVVPAAPAADPRSPLLGAFHNLLAKCIRYYEQADDLQTVPDGFPILNSLRETQLLLGEGAHNQYGDLPFMARCEMLLQQRLLARPEMERFLGGRPMTPYPEPWMDRIDVMKGMLGVVDASIIHYADLAWTGERLMLSIRFGPWARNGTRNDAAYWAWRLRDDVMTYLHAYRAVTGVDIAAAALGSRPVDVTPPSVHLQRRVPVRQP